MKNNGHIQIMNHLFFSRYNYNSVIRWETRLIGQSPRIILCSKTCVKCSGCSDLCPDPWLSLCPRRIVHQFMSIQIRGPHEPVDGLNTLAADF